MNIVQRRKKERSTDLDSCLDHHPCLLFSRYQSDSPANSDPSCLTLFPENLWSLSFILSFFQFCPYFLFVFIHFIISLFSPYCSFHFFSIKLFYFLLYFIIFHLSYFIFLIIFLFTSLLYNVQSIRENHLTLNFWH